ncbi:MAG: hypothetical protein B6D79_01960 [gamma proteobacterium symbiont of Ctena orbiculata]|nr:MAG: hypothetical protein B6D79_01960 [gamma proteobacterium symbiont of Ctena orbiculata]
MIRYMMRDNWQRWGGFGLMLLVVSGCNTLAFSAIRVLDKGYVCSVNQPAGVQLVSDSDRQKSDSARIGNAPQQNTDNSADQDQFWVIRVNMGQQPSGGYGLRLLSDRLEISSNRARVTLEWLQPKPGSVQMQALTYPCLYLKIAKGDYSQLEIVDQDGEVRFDLNLN